MSPQEITAADREALAALERAREAQAAAERAEWLRLAAQAERR